MCNLQSTASVYQIGARAARGAGLIAKVLSQLASLFSPPQLQYATPVKDLLFSARLEFLLSQSGCVLHGFQNKRGHVPVFL